MARPKMYFHKKALIFCFASVFIVSLIATLIVKSERVSTKVEENLEQNEKSQNYSNLATRSSTKRDHKLAVKRLSEYLNSRKENLPKNQLPDLHVDDYIDERVRQWESLSEEGKREWERENQLISENFWELAPIVYDSILKEQQPDRGWNVSLMKEGSEFLRNNGFGKTEIVETDCRSKLCKIVFRHQDAASASYFRTNEKVSDGPWHGGQFGAPIDNNGKYQTRLFYTPTKYEAAVYREVRNRMIDLIEDQTS